jgi:branched-chain amino acid transport system ATP-binding protein
MSGDIMASQRGKARSDRAPTLSVRGLEVRFGAFTAVSGVDLDVWPGEIVGVIGPNGAGKSTLVNALAGVVTPRTGAITLNDRSLARQRPSKRARLGLVRTFQTAELFGSLSVHDNIALGRHGVGSAPDQSFVDVATGALRLDAVTELSTDNLGGGQRKLVELLRALAATPDVLLLDEPVAGVPTRDRTKVLDLLRRHVDERDAGALLIEHDMDFVSSICDWVYVMNAGEVIASGPWEQISTNRTVLDAYIGSAGSATPVGEI